MVLVEDGGNFFSILADGQEGLLVVVGGNVELEHVGATSWAGEDSSVSVKTSTNVAVSALEGEVLLAATIVGLGSVGVEINTKGLSVEGLLLTVSGSSLSICSGIKSSNVSLATIIFRLSKVLEVGNFSFAGIIFSLGPSIK